MTILKNLTKKITEHHLNLERNVYCVVFSFQTNFNHYQTMMMNLTNSGIKIAY